MSYLVVVAHPDDEVLGAGATIYKLTQQGHEVNVCIMSGQAMARNLRPSNEDLDHDISASTSLIGVNRVIIGNFPNIKMNTSSHLELVQFIEKAIVETGATNVITHHPADTNNDHYHTSIACQAAVRLNQRGGNASPLNELLYMEVPSSTEWALNTAVSVFRPNTFIEVGKEAVEKKIEALSCYRDVMRPYPHPRSVEAITGLALYRGAMSGSDYAEAFECVFRKID